MRPFYLESRAPFLCLLHEPSPDRFTGTAVILVPPFGWEEVASYRPRRRWAEALAADGHVALRIQLPGTGDSAGGPYEPDLLGAWTEAVSAAARWLADAGARRVVAIGIGLGGMVTMRAVADGAPISDVVLWSAGASGRKLIRAMRAFAAMQNEAGGDSLLAPGGYVLAPETIDSIEELDITALDLRGAPDRRALVLGRDRPPRDAALERHLTVAGFEVTTAAGHGYAEMTTVPDGARPPAGTMAEVARWLPAASGSRFAVHAMPQSADLGAVRETAVAFSNGSFGILAEPAGGASAHQTAVLLNAGAIWRAGPNRLWVEAARRWGACGLPSLRLDVEGVGDAEGVDVADADVSLYAERFVSQVREVLDDIAGRGLPDRYALAGLCSGAYWALHAAIADDRVTVAAQLNTRLLSWDADLVAARESARVLKQARGPAWRRGLRGEWDVRKMARHARSLSHAVLTRPRARSVRPGGVDEVLGALARSDARFVLAFSEQEPLHDELAATGALVRLAELPGVELARLAGSDHTLRSLAAQRSAHEILDRAVLGAPADVAT